jgi:hypothetical protein
MMTQRYRTFLAILTIAASALLFTHCAGLSILDDRPTISTSLSDAVYQVPFLDDSDPETFTPTEFLSRGPGGGFALEPGRFELHAESYCLHAGKYVPSVGEGYLYAPLKGPRAEIMGNLLKRSVDHPEITQSQIQTLIWAVLARTRVDDLSSEMQAVAATLLTKAIA